MTDYTATIEEVYEAWIACTGEHESLSGYLLKRDLEQRQLERDRLLALAKGVVVGCAGLDCEECERIIFIQDVYEIFEGIKFGS